MSDEPSTLWQKDMRSYKEDTIEDKQAKELSGDSLFERIRNSKFVGLFYFLYIVFLPLMLLIETALVMSYYGYGSRRRTRSSIFRRIFWKR
jgi:hypothetical protein